MKTTVVTCVVMVLGLALWIGWDIVVASNGVKGDTISEITARLAKAVPLIALATGVVAGHLFGSFDAIAPAAQFVKAHSLIPFLCGVIMGVFFWSQAT